MNNTLFGLEMGKKYPKDRETEGICYHGIRLRTVGDPIKDRLCIVQKTATNYT